MFKFDANIDRKLWELLEEKSDRSYKSSLFRLDLTPTIGMIKNLIPRIFIELENLQYVKYSLDSYRNLRSGTELKYSMNSRLSFLANLSLTNRAFINSIDKRTDLITGIMGQIKYHAFPGYFPFVQSSWKKQSSSRLPKNYDHFQISIGVTASI